jgi:hypothetical protein
LGGELGLQKWVLLVANGRCWRNFLGALSQAGVSGSTSKL